MNRTELGERYFKEGYNCAQAVVLAFEDLTELNRETLSKVSCPFGGGLSRMREVCGAVSGMAIVMGLLYGKDASDQESKSETYERTQEVIKKFEEKNGAIVCRELLGLTVKHEGPEASKRNEAFYSKRPCVEYVKDAVQILEEYIDAHSYK